MTLPITISTLLILLLLGTECSQPSKLYKKKASLKQDSIQNVSKNRATDREEPWLTPNHIGFWVHEQMTLNPRNIFATAQRYGLEIVLTSSQEMIADIDEPHPTGRYVIELLNVSDDLATARDAFVAELSNMTNIYAVRRVSWFEFTYETF